MNWLLGASVSFLEVVRQTAKLHGDSVTTQPACSRASDIARKTCTRQRCKPKNRLMSDFVDGS